MAGQFEKILLPLDGTEIANQALPLAGELAQRLQAELVLIRVVPDLQYEVHVRETIPSLDLNDDKQLALVDHASRWLRRVEENLALHRITTKSVVDVGDAAERILAYASADAVNLIVMSTHGRRGVPRLLHGSVATRVLNDAPCPVMLVHPQEQGGVVEPVSQEVAPAS